MPNIGSETYRSTELPDATKETYPAHAPAESIHGEDWPVAEAPVLHGLNPATLTVPGADYPVTVHGEGFTEASVINWNGGDEETDYISQTQLRTLVKPSTVQAPLPFTLPVYVHHGNIASNVLAFTFIAEAPPEEPKPEGAFEPKERELAREDVPEEEPLKMPSEDAPANEPRTGETIEKLAPPEDEHAV
jgi:hypothetical protein